MRISDWSSDVCSSDLITGFILGNGTTYLKEHGWILCDSEPASWWIVALEYALYFFLFDTYFYWLHRWIHQPLVSRWIHTLHHRSVSPNLLTTLSVSPLERSEARRVGNECVSQCRSPWSPEHLKNNKCHTPLHPSKT